MSGVIRVCPNPNCDAIFHNVPPRKTECLDCSARTVTISEEWYWKKFSDSFFQYDYNTHEFFYPTKHDHE